MTLKPEDVTDAMVYAFTEIADYKYLDKEIIAAAFNAVISNNERITAEWLDANPLYINYSGLSLEYHCELKDAAIDIHFFPAGVQVFLTNDGGFECELTQVKTIGQLRCLHAALGIAEAGRG